MQGHGQDELPLHLDDAETILLEYGAHGVERQCRKRARIRFHSHLDHVQRPRKSLHSLPDGEFADHEASGQPALLGHQVTPGSNVGEQANAAYDVEGGIISGNVPQCAEQVLEPTRILRFQPRYALETRRRAAVNDDRMTAGKEQLSELRVSAADIEDAERSDSDPVEQYRYRSCLPLQEERARLAREAQSVLISCRHDVRAVRVVGRCLSGVSGRRRNGLRVLHHVSRAECSRSDPAPRIATASLLLA